MNASEAVFKSLLAVTVTLAVLLLALFPFQEPGTGSYVVSVLALVVQAVIIAVTAAALSVGWEPFDFLDEQ